jgi:hypothetical protein
MADSLPCTQILDDGTSESKMQKNADYDTATITDVEGSYVRYRRS